MESHAGPLIQCSVCGFRFDPEDEVPACQVCPLGGLIRRCGLVRCPQCGFDQPAPWGARARVRRRGQGEGKGHRWDGGGGTPPDAARLSDLAEGERARVLRVEARGASLHKLLAMGVLPGVELAMVQRRPVPVVQVGYTTLALDEALAQAVAVLRLPGPGPARGPGAPGPGGRGAEGPGRGGPRGRGRWRRFFPMGQ